MGRGKHVCVFRSVFTVETNVIWLLNVHIRRLCIVGIPGSLETKLCRFVGFVYGILVLLIRSPCLKISSTHADWPRIHNIMRKTFGLSLV